MLDADGDQFGQGAALAVVVGVPGALIAGGDHIVDVVDVVDGEVEVLEHQNPISLAMTMAFAAATPGEIPSSNIWRQSRSIPKSAIAAESQPT